MATLKHINSKNADYGAAEQYLLFEHDEFTMKPVLDETGRLTKIISEALADLLNKECIVYLKRSNNFLKLKESSGVDIPQEINKRIENLRATLSVRDILNKSSFDSFMYPTSYNDEHEITRYFDFVFIDSNEFLNVEDWEMKIRNTSADGVVYAIVPKSEEEIKRIRATLVNGVANDRVVFCLPKKYVNIEKIAFEYRAVMDLKAMVVDDELLSDEYDIYIEDLEEVISSFIYSYARPENGGADYYYNGEKKAIFRKAQMSALLSRICEETYPHAPIINNESINKNILPTVAINSRSKLLLGLVGTTLEKNLGLSGTGQDISIMRSTLLQTGILENIDTVPTINLTPNDENIRYMLHTIQEFIVGAGINGEQCFGDLYTRLTSPRYGIGLKNGVIPIYIAVVLHLYRNNIVIKKGSSEQKLTPELLNMINDTPSSFSIVLENWSEEKTAYMNQLEQLFQDYIHEQERSYNSFSYLVMAMCRWYMALPKYAKEMVREYKGITAKEQFKAVSTSHKKFVNSLKQLDINPRAYLFEKIFEIFGFREFNINVVDNITQTKREYDEAIPALVIDFPELKQEIIDRYKRAKPDYDLDRKELEHETGYVELVGTNENYPKFPDGFHLHDYQEQAIEEWKHQGFCGIFDMATGTGKTYTGLGALTTLAQSVDNKLAAIIVCPYQHLVEQWVEDIEKFNIHPIIGYSGSSQKDWKKQLEDAIRDQKLRVRNREFFCFVCTNATYASEFVQKQINMILKVITRSLSIQEKLRSTMHKLPKSKSVSLQ